MKNYLPLSGSTLSLLNQIEDYKNVLDITDYSIFKDIDDGKIETPILLSELTNAKTETIKLSVDAALKLQIPIGSIDNKFSRTIFIQEFKQYKEIVKAQERIHFGISIRWIINIQKLNSSANITTLPLIAASGQFNYVNASARFEVNGISSQVITSLIPAPKDLTTETFGEFNQAFLKIKDKIWDKDTNITPTIIGIYANFSNNSENKLEDSALIYYALKMISKGKSLDKALEEISDESKKEIVKNVYFEVTESSDINSPINNSSKQKALKYMTL